MTPKQFEALTEDRVLTFPTAKEAAEECKALWAKLSKTSIGAVHEGLTIVRRDSATGADLGSVTFEQSRLVL